MIKFKMFSINNLDRSKFIFDLIFYALGFYAFYANIGLVVVSIILNIVLLKVSNYYDKDLNAYYLDSFIDFLNQINSNLAIGMGFDSAIIASSKELHHDQSYSSQTLHLINRSIQLGIDVQSIFEILNERFPIPEATLFSRMMLLSKETGSNPSNIADITLDKLYMTYKVKQEINTILFQKKMEQSILCIAPMVIILFIKSTSSDFMVILYQTLIGKGVMSLSFLLIIIMKFISEKIVRFDI